MTDHTSFSRRLRPCETAAAQSQPTESTGNGTELPASAATPTPRKDILLNRWEEYDIPIEGQRNQALEQLVVCERELAAYQQAERELPEEPKGWGCQVAEYESEWVVAIEDYRALRAAAVAWRMDAKKWHAQFCEAEAALAAAQKDADRYRCYCIQSPPPKCLDFSTPQQRDKFYDAAIEAAKEQSK